MVMENRTMMRKLIVFTLLIAFPQSFSLLWGSDVRVESQGSGKIRTEILKKANTMLGVPYVSGGVTRKGLDCSGLTYVVYKEIAGITLPRMVYALSQYGRDAGKNLSPADLLFFDTEGTGKPSHVALYIGSGKFIHAASAGKRRGVIVSSLDEAYYKPKFLGARRILPAGWPKVCITMDGKPGVANLKGVLMPGSPLYFSLNRKTKGNEFLTFKAYKEDKEILSRQVKVMDKGDGSLIWFLPDKGSWKVVVSERGGKKLLTLTFSGS
jgi:hypothetical protein